MKKIVSDGFRLSMLPFKVANIHIEDLSYTVFKEEIKDAEFYVTDSSALKVLRVLTGKEIKPNTEPFLLLKNTVLYVCEVRTPIAMEDEGLIKVAYRNYKIQFWKIFVKECKS